MSLGQEVVEALKERGMTPQEAGIPYSRSMLGKIKRGERKIAKDIAPIVTTKLDKSVVYLKAWHELTGGVGPEFLDGRDIEFHRATLKERLLREFEEAVKALMEFDTSKPPDRVTDRELRVARERLMELLDSFSFGYTFLSIICDEYGFSFKDLHAQHHARLKQAGLVN